VRFTSFKRSFFIKLAVFCEFLPVLSGCIYKDEPMPQIITGPQSSTILVEPVAKLSTDVPIEGNVRPEWIPPSYLERKWAAIVIHHSGTSTGNARIFDKWHAEKNHWEGVGYDFVIGNGTDSGDGEVEVTFRWRGQKTGAHCGGTRGNWANEYAVGICLVGDFNNTVPTRRQMQSLISLIKFLQNRYGIPTSRIYGHKDTPGARPTDCPGKNFSLVQLRMILSR
jgi:hypothetical protein